MKHLDERIDAWAKTVGIHDGSGPMKQALYTLSETQELLEAVHSVEEAVSDCNMMIDSPYHTPEDYEESSDRLDTGKEEVADAIGDIYVTLKNVAYFYGLDMERCVTMAVETIEERARKGGKMEGGVYVKESE